MNDNTPISNQHDAFTTSSHDLESSTPLSSPDPLPVARKSSVGILLSEVPEKELGWLWEDRLPLGKLTTLEGEGSLGKSALAFDLVTRVSSGQPMPDGTPGIEGGAGVVLIAPHQDPSDTFVPRLRRAGADLSRIATISTVPVTDPKTGLTSRRPFRLPDDCDLLAEVIEEVQAKLVLIDPLMSMINPKLASRDPQLQDALFPLQMLIQQAGATCLIVGHSPKARRKPRHVDEIQSWLLAASSGLLVVRDPTDQDKRVLAHITSRLSPLAVSLSFQIEHKKESGAHCSSISWLGPCSYSLHELFTPPVTPPAGAVRQQILEVLKQSAPETLTVKDLAAALPHIDNANLRQTVRRMAADQQIQHFSRGYYAFIFPKPPVSPQQHSSHFQLDYQAIEEMVRLAALRKEAEQARLALQQPFTSVDEEQLHQKYQSHLSQSTTYEMLLHQEQLSQPPQSIESDQEQP